MAKARAALAAAAGLAGLLSCLAPPPASERASDAARQLNTARRFGRMDVALEAVAPAFREDFVRRHAHWGETVRIFDVELVGLTMKDASNATVLVDLSWAQSSSSTLMRTRVEQKWADQGKGWALRSEKRLTGDLGLFGEAALPQPEARPDVHFPTRTLK